MMRVRPNAAYDTRTVLEQDGGEIGGNCHIEVIKTALRHVQRARVVHPPAQNPIPQWQLTYGAPCGFSARRRTYDANRTNPVSPCGDQGSAWPPTARPHPRAKG